MEDKIEQLIIESSLKMDQWIEVLNDYIEKRNNYEFPIDDMITLTHKAADVLAEINDLFIKYGGFKDEFDNSCMYVYPNLELIIKSKKTRMSFNFGIDYKGIYIRTSLLYIENIRYMDDDFYKSLLKLLELGDFELRDNEPNTATKKLYKGLFNTKKSIIYRLLRNYIVDVLEEDDNISSGEIFLQWNQTMSFESVLRNSLESFKILYQLNYSLWKISDLQAKKNKAI